eukprot:TRINITY_DN2297_c0_g5_i1.p1 TRINITY_DN2297_c0_g5~~TRINITY_DN2297_c0_g5_i1.p1  ORF type:complete len:339 (-),score=80.59 TRINITY_DN2297_c0_g5_i1:778-1755(-)
MEYAYNLNMGIQGLLLALKQIQQRKHLREYKGERVAIDAFCWLHKGAYSCALELAKGLPTRKYIEYFMKRLRAVQDAGLTPVVVFDGGRLPMKRETEEARGRSRQLHRREGDELWNRGKREAAIRKYSEGIVITGTMAFELIKVLRRKSVEYVVAPYEADAQMTFLFLERDVSLVITEDSDLLAFGCERVLFKLDNEGYGYEIDMSNIGKVTEFNFSGFSKDMFLKMCILNGCDYLASIKGIGLKKAHGLVKQNNDIKEIVKQLKALGKYEIPETYETAFTQAFLTFKFQTVYNMKEQQLTSLNKMEGTSYTEIFNYKDKSFLGP